MPDRRELTNRSDIEFLVDEFYKRIIKDETIGKFFTEIVVLDWDVHIPIMCDFWESVLFGVAKYKGNPILSHIELDRKLPLEDLHFDRWLLHWNNTLAEFFEGSISEVAQQKAEMMATLIKVKIKSSKDPNFIQ